jgi:hypothetical protein
MKEDLKLRMYFFVPYNISPIQQAIQAGHAALEYADKYCSEEQFIKFVREHKTWVILNGGTTNSKRELGTGIANGSLDQIWDVLLTNDIPFACFNEPDLNDALTAVCFIASEEVFDYEEYPDFVDHILDIKMYTEAKATMDRQNIGPLRKMSYLELQKLFPEWYAEWENMLGGEKNVFLRELIKGKKLA